MYNIAIILAGGIGSRVGGDTPKQLLLLDDGRSILEHSVDAFDQAPCIDEVAIVMHPEWMDEAKTIVARNCWQKVKTIIPGGTERWESSWHAIEAYAGQPSDVNLLLHDAARPFVSQTIIANICKALEQHEAVTVAVPSTDTLYRIKNEKLKIKNGVEPYPIVESIPARREYMRAQTPQAFRLTIIRKAFEKALAQGNIGATDDVGIVHRYMPETAIFIVPGEETNKKITYKGDL